MIDLDLAAINLVVDDRDAQAIFDAGLAKFIELAPTARPRNGSVEALLLEAFATASADTIYALNRVVSLTVEGILNLYGVVRFGGASAAGEVTLTLDGVRTLTVTAGQRLADPKTGLTLLVTSDVSITAASSIVLPCHTEDSSGAGNSISVGDAIDLVDSIPYAASAVVSLAFTGGADVESDTSFIDRASSVFARVTSSLVLPVHFIAYMLEDARVGRATAVDLYMPGGTVGADLGHITVYAYGRSALLSSLIKAELLTQMNDRSASMITVHLEDPTITTQAVTLTVQALAGYSTTAVRDAVTAALTAWMNPDVWPWGRDIMTTEIIDIAADVVGVDYVTTVTTPASNVVLGISTLANIGTITVTVTT